MSVDAEIDDIGRRHFLRGVAVLLAAATLPVAILEARNDSIRPSELRHEAVYRPEYLAFEHHWTMEYGGKYLHYSVLIDGTDLYTREFLEAAHQEQAIKKFGLFIAELRS